GVSPPEWRVANPPHALVFYSAAAGRSGHISGESVSATRRLLRALGAHTMPSQTSRSDTFGAMNPIVTIARLTVANTAPARAQHAAATLDAATAGRFAALALACVQ